MKSVRVAVLLTVLLFATARAQDKQTGRDTGKIEPLPRDVEMQLALSALPRHLRDGATVYGLNPAKGFEVTRKGTNGFHAFVARIGDDTFRGSWPLKAYRTDILYPISFDEAGAKANMRVFFDAAEAEARGTPPEDLKRTIQERYQTHYYKPPERAGVSYMMAPILRTYVTPDANELVCTTIVPHVMHYVPNIDPAAIGASTPTSDDLRYFCEHGKYRKNPDPFEIFHGVHGYLIQFLGVTERAAIRTEYQGLLDRVCALKNEWCLPK